MFPHAILLTFRQVTSLFCSYTALLGLLSSESFPSQLKAIANFSFEQPQEDIIITPIK